MAPTEATPQDRPHLRSNVASNNYNAEQGTTSTVGTMQHDDLEVAQACLNLRQDSKGQGAAGAGGTNTSAASASVTGDGGSGSGQGQGRGQGQTQEQRGSGTNGDDNRNPSQTLQQMNQRSGSGGMNHMAPMPPIPPPNDGGGRMPMQMGMMPGPYGMMDHLGGGGGPNSMPPGGSGNSTSSGSDRNNGPGGSYYNMVDNSGHFYPPMHHDPEQYHAMMNGMGAMRDMSYYGMNMMNHNDPNMMNHNGHFYPHMMPTDSGHFNSMMNNYPQGGGGSYMQQKRQHPDDYSTQNDYKRRRSNNPNSPNKVEDGPPVQKKIPEKQKKGKRASDMPRRPLSAYNFFFSEERERILAAIPDPEEEKEGEGKVEKAKETNAGSEGGSPSSKGEGKPSEGTGEVTNSNTKSNTVTKTNANTEGTKDKIKKLKGCEEVVEKMTARSRRLLDMREQTGNKRRPHRKTHGKIGFKELVKKIGERWRALQPDEREYYADLAEQDLKRYKEQMSEYNNKHSRLNS